MRTQNKVFIPDNEGGGTWETFTPKPKTASGNFTQREADECNTAERDHYKAHAEALALALREVELRTTQARIASGIGKRKNQTEFLLGELERIAGAAREALARWEGAK